MDFQVITNLNFHGGLLLGDYDVFTSVTHERMEGKGDRITP